MDTRSLIEDGFENRAALAPGRAPRELLAAIDECLQLLGSGGARVAEPEGGGWRVNEWLKMAVLLHFRTRDNAVTESGPFRWFDKVPLKHEGYAAERFRSDGARIVPGAIVRAGAFVGRDAVLMPSFVNVGAYVGDDSMIDSHALVGSCAQVGARVHVSASAQIGGVIEPVGALPVIVEDDVLVGGNCGVYEGAILKRRVVLAAGTIITGSTPIYDLPNGRIIQAAPGEPLIVPEGAVVVPGTRPVSTGQGREWGLSVATPIIVKYRDEKTSARTALEAWIR